MPGWFTEWAAGVTLWDLITWVAWAAAVVGAVWKGGPVIRKVSGLLSASIKLVDTLATLPADLETIKHELEANSGKSVKDITTRTELAVSKLTSEVSHVKRQAAALKTAQASTNRLLMEHLAANPD